MGLINNLFKSEEDRILNINSLSQKELIREYVSYTHQIHEGSYNSNTIKTYDVLGKRISEKGLRSQFFEEFANSKV